MSVQFGRWDFDGKPVDRGYLEKARATIVPYGPDDAGSYLKGNISILYHAFHTTKESRRETQPHTTASGAVITWDGRLDNRAELICQLRNVPSIGSTDVSIVAAAYEEWGKDCFCKLIGDWALSIWDPHTRSLILAKDPIGTRHLYYSFDNNQVTWSTILDPLVLFAGETFSLCEEYIAGWLSFFPATHLTPYVGIHSVPPSCFVRLEPGRQTSRKYWDFSPSKRIRYRSDAEYEKHFRTVLAEAVLRRLRSDSPILAELSGGMDSSSIVCMADVLLAQGSANGVRLDTVSYYDDSEPNWDERPYFSSVEQMRCQAGHHIDVGTANTCILDLKATRFRSTPGHREHSSKAASEFASHLASAGHRVLLSGIGGDEVLGGVLSPTPELADLLRGLELRKFAHQLKSWAVQLRKPWIHLLHETARSFCLPPRSGSLPVSWLQRGFASRQGLALSGYGRRLRAFGSRPSHQLNLLAFHAIQRQLCSTPLPSAPPYERRHPYLDRTLLEFLFAIPREQLLQPGRRRSLMRRALVGIVPKEILERKRKAYVARSSMSVIGSAFSELSALSKDMASSLYGFVDDRLFLVALEKIRAEEEVPVVPLIRTIGLEYWLRVLARTRCLSSTPNLVHPASDFATGGKGGKPSVVRQSLS